MRYRLRLLAISMWLTAAASAADYKDVAVSSVSEPDAIIVDAAIAGQAAAVPVHVAYLAFLRPSRAEALGQDANGRVVTEEFITPNQAGREAASAFVRMFFSPLKTAADGKVHVDLVAAGLRPGGRLEAIIVVDPSVLPGDHTEAVCLEEMAVASGFACYDRRQGAAPAPWHERLAKAEREAQEAKRGCWTSDTAAMAALAEACQGAK